MIKRIDAAAVQLVTRENIRALARGKTQPLTCDCCGEPIDRDEELVFVLPPLHAAAGTMGGTKCDVCGYVNKHYEPGDYCDGCGSALSPEARADREAAAEWDVHPEPTMPYPTVGGSRAQLRRMFDREPTPDETAAYHAGRVEYHERYLARRSPRMSTRDALLSWAAKHPVLTVVLAVVAWAGIGLVVSSF